MLKNKTPTFHFPEKWLINLQQGIIMWCKLKCKATVETPSTLRNGKLLQKNKQANISARLRIFQFMFVLYPFICLASRGH